MAVKRAHIEYLIDVLRRERQWCDRVFRGRQHAAPVRRTDAKVGEIDEALMTVHAVEGALKEAGLLEETLIQAALLPLHESGEPGRNGDDGEDTL